MIKLSVVIPSYRDPLMTRTVDALLAASELGDALEIVVTLDGYWPAFELRGDRRVRYVHLGKNVGMRRAINAAVRLARGEYLMRADEHQTFGQGYDRILTDACRPNWIVTPRRYFLDPVQWRVMDLAPVDYMALKIVGQGPGRKFSGVARPGDDSQAIQESQAMQGSCWLMRRAWWDSVIGELQHEGFGPHYQDSHEMVFKTWRAGGGLYVVKDTWHAHKHRDFPRTHSNGTPENPSNNEACWAYSLSVWEDYYRQEVLPRWQGR